MLEKDTENVKNMPLVTIIVGIYNGERYLAECIDSILKQDYTNIEIILVDDGSPDDCGKIVDEYAAKDNRINVIDQENAGVSISRNNALNVAKGEYICIIDQDDCISSDYVSYFYNLIKENNAEIALTRQPKKFFGKYEEENLQIKDKTEIWSGEQAVIEMLYHKIVIAPWNKMISRALIEKNSMRFNHKYFCGEGFAFSIECFQQANRVAVGQRKVYNYRVGDPESGASKFRESTIHSSIDAQQYIKSKLINKTPEILKAWNFSNWHTHCDCLNIMVGCGVTSKYKELYTNIKKVCQKEALCAIKAPVSAQQKLRGILFKINPYIASKIINFFRIRKFKKEI